MNVADITSLLGLIQGLLLSAVILLANRSDRPTRLLGFFILTLTLRILPFLLLRRPFGAEHRWVVWLPLYFWYTSTPLLYLYARRLMGRLNWRKDYIHLIPGAVEITVLTILLAADLWQAGPLFSPKMTYGIIGVHSFVAIVPAAVYSFLTITLLQKHQDDILKFYSNLDGKRLQWIKIAIIYLLVFAMVYTLLRYGPLPVPPEVLHIYGAISNTLAIYYLTAYGIRQVALQSVAPNFPEIQPDDKREEIGDGNDHQKLYETIENYMKEHRPYLDPHLTIAHLSENTGISERNLSRVINAESGIHFNAYVNRYRVGCAKKLLRDKNFHHYTMEGIASESGFNNKATFYQAFKLYSKLSPAAYRKQYRSTANFN